MTCWVSCVAVFPVDERNFCAVEDHGSTWELKYNELVYSLKFVSMFVKEIILSKPGIIKSLIYTLNTLCPWGWCRDHGIKWISAQFHKNISSMNDQLDMHHLPYLDDLLDSMFLHQQLYVLHFHSPAQSVHESKRQKLAIPLSNSKTFRAVSGIFFSSRYQGRADSRCFVFIFWKLWFSVSVYLKEQFCLISFSSDCAWVSVAHCYDSDT